MTEKGPGWGLSADDVAWGAELWVREPARRANPGASPLHASDLEALPPTLIVTAEHDPLRDDGHMFADRLAAAGVPVRHRCQRGMIRGFLMLDTVSPVAAQAGMVFSDVSSLLAAGCTIADIGALLSSLSVGPFGFHESIQAPFVTESLVIETLTLLVLLAWTFLITAAPMPPASTGQRADRLAISGRITRQGSGMSCR